MKSAYELAMERLKADDPESVRTLTDEQKTRLAEANRVYEGKLAEREIFLRRQLEETESKGEFDEAEKIRAQIKSERARLEEEREAEKEKIRKG